MIPPITLADRQLAIDTSYLKPSIYPLYTLYLPSIYPLSTLYIPLSIRRRLSAFAYKHKNFYLQAQELLPIGKSM